MTRFYIAAVAFEWPTDGKVGAHVDIIESLSAAGARSAAIDHVRVIVPNAKIHDVEVHEVTGRSFVA